MIRVWLLIIILFMTIGMVGFFILRGGLGKFLGGNRIRWVFGGYAVILLVSVGLSAFIPVREAPVLESGQAKKYEEEAEQLRHLVYTGRTEEINSDFFEKEWEKEYREPHLSVAIQHEDYVNLQIVVERKTVNDGKIEGIFFKSKTVIGDVDFTDQMNSIRLKWSEDGLTLINPKPVVVNLAMAQKEFPITQFTGEKWFVDFHDLGRMTFGQRFLYLRVPKDLKITAHESISVDYLGG